MSFGSQMFGDQLKPDIAESSAVLAEEIQRAMNGDLSLASRIFTSQAISLDALFTDMARRSGNNMGHYPDAADRYMRLALKAQAACRSTLEALAPFEATYGSFDAFAAETQAGIDAGQFDSREMPLVLNCIRRWHSDGVWGLWRWDRIWEMAR